MRKVDLVAFWGARSFGWRFWFVGIVSEFRLWTSCRWGDQRVSEFVGWVLLEDFGWH